LKNILILLLLCLMACNKYDIQPEQASGFIKFFSTGLAEAGYDVKPTADGGYIAVGTSSDESGIRDIYLVKTDQYGNEEPWSPVIIGGEGDDVATSLQIVSDGFIILGSSNDASGSGSYDLYLVKTDLQGNILWERRTGGPNDDRGTHLEVLSGGGFLAAGITSSYGLGARNAYFISYDAGGNPVKSETFGVESKTVFDTYIIEATSDYVICGSIGTVDPEVSEIFIALIDKQNLGVKNFRYQGSGTNHYGKCIQELPDGNLVLVGNAVNAQGYSDVYLQKFSPGLSSVWVHENIDEPGELSDLNVSAIRVAPDNSLAIIGTRAETENDDLMLLLTDTDGNQPEIILYGDDGYQRGNSLEVTASDNGWIIVGTNGFEDESMMALIKTDSRGGL
jgi:hypothetical protein